MSGSDLACILRQPDMYSRLNQLYQGQLTIGNSYIAIILLTIKSDNVFLSSKEKLLTAI